MDAEEFLEPIFPAPNGPQRASSALDAGRKKVALLPGHSPLDWANLRQATKPVQLRRITEDELALHNKKEDAWIALQGKVYDMTAYIPFHPGGRGQLMRGAGKDATSLFMKVHSWVNVERMLDNHCLGFLTSKLLQ